MNLCAHTNSTALNDCLMGQGSPYASIIIFLGITILFQIVSAMLPTANTAGDAINATGAPLGSLFASGGVVFLLIMASLILLIVKVTRQSK